MDVKNVIGDDIRTEPATRSPCAMKDHAAITDDKLIKALCEHEKPKQKD